MPASIAASSGLSSAAHGRFSSSPQPWWSGSWPKYVRAADSIP